MFSIFFLNKRCIAKHNREKVGCSRCGINFTLESLFYKFGQQSAMINMAMSYNNKVNFFRVEVKILIIETIQVFSTLK